MNNQEAIHTVLCFLKGRDITAIQTSSINIWLQLKDNTTKAL